MKVIHTNSWCKKYNDDWKNSIKMNISFFIPQISRLSFPWNEKIIPTITELYQRSFLIEKCFLTLFTNNENCELFWRTLKFCKFVSYEKGQKYCVVNCMRPNSGGDCSYESKKNILFSSHLLKEISPTKYSFNFFLEFQWI